MSAALAGLVLAAGASSRMGRPKALLPLPGHGRPFARVICETLEAAGVAPIVIVTRESLRRELTDLLPGATVAINPAPERGQLSSILAGLDALGAPGAVLMTLVDLPLVQVATVASLVDAWRQSHAPLVRPVHEGRHGHPVIFGAPLLVALRSADPAAGAKPVVHRFLAQAVSVPVDDAGTLDDIDTPDAYGRLGRT